MSDYFKALHGLTLPGELDRWARDSPDRTAIVDGSQRLSFARLDQISDQLAAALVQQGITKGDVVSCQLPNIWEYVCLFLATSKVGAIFNAQNTVSRAHEVKYALGFAESKAFFYVPESGGFDYRNMLDQIQGELPGLALRVTVRGEAGPGEASFESLLDTEADPSLRALRPDPDDLLILTFTSGTSGTPKGVVHPHDGPVSNSVNLTHLLEMGPEDTLLSASSYSFAYGTYTIMIGLVAGARQVLMETFDADGFFELLEREKVSHVFGVPAIATMLVNHPRVESTDFGSLRQFMLAGAPHPPALVYKLHEHFDCTPVMLWGMTETYRGTVTRLDDDLETIANTVGSYHPGWEMKIIGPDGSELERGEAGELVIRGPWLFREYIRSPGVMEVAAGLALELRFLLLPHLDTGWRRTNLVCQSPVRREGQSGDHSGVVQHPEVAMQNRSGQATGSTAGQLGRILDTEKGTIASTQAGRDEKRIVIQLTLDVLGHFPAQVVDPVAGSHRLL